MIPGWFLGKFCVWLWIWLAKMLKLFDTRSTWILYLDIREGIATTFLTLPFFLFKWGSQMRH